MYFIPSPAKHGDPKCSFSELNHINICVAESWMFWYWHLWIQIRVGRRGAISTACIQWHRNLLWNRRLVSSSALLLQATGMAGLHALPSEIQTEFPSTAVLVLIISPLWSDVLCKAGGMHIYFKQYRLMCYLKIALVFRYFRWLTLVTATLPSDTRTKW